MVRSRTKSKSDKRAFLIMACPVHTIDTGGKQAGDMRFHPNCLWGIESSLERKPSDQHLSVYGDCAKR